MACSTTSNATSPDLQGTENRADLHPGSTYTNNNNERSIPGALDVFQTNSALFNTTGRWYNGQEIYTEFINNLIM
jgi:hypothetical protein